jgi:hypothetical protein
MEIILYVIVDKEGRMIYTSHVRSWCDDYLKNHHESIKHYGKLKIVTLKGEL